MWKLRRVLSGLSGGENGNNAAGLEMLIDRLGSFRTNEEFLSEVAKAPERRRLTAHVAEGRGRPGTLVDLRQPARNSADDR